MAVCELAEVAWLAVQDLASLFTPATHLPRGNPQTHRPLPKQGGSAVVAVGAAAATARWSCCPVLNSTWWASRSGAVKAWDKQGQIKTRAVGVNDQDEMTKISRWSMLGLETREVEVVVWSLLAAAAMNRSEPSTTVLGGATARWNGRLRNRLLCSFARTKLISPWTQADTLPPS